MQHSFKDLRLHWGRHAAMTERAALKCLDEYSHTISLINPELEKIKNTNSYFAQQLLLWPI